ncbi:unnamed protein product [Strongylus vulgaris]|uniref:Uncharacterized protein n=1 Tax=Strongylus vulgaris TaxID=40348 RepID=A0A3P7LS61_STRVU|nr:unnamed protein product [Strongylus vulgaris]
MTRKSAKKSGVCGSGRHKILRKPEAVQEDAEVGTTDSASVERQDSDEEFAEPGPDNMFSDPDVCDSLDETEASSDYQGLRSKTSKSGGVPNTEVS